MALEHRITAIRWRNRREYPVGLAQMVGDRLEEDSAVAELDHVVLERFQLDAAVARHVRDTDLAEVGEAEAEHGHHFRRVSRGPPTDRP